MTTATLLIIAKIWEQHKCPLTDEWIKKMWHIYIYMPHIWYIHTYGIHTYMVHIHIYTHSVTIKNEIMPFAAT